MPRVLRVITRLNVGGPATHVSLVNRGLEGRGWETLLAFGKIDAGEAEASLDPSLDAMRIPGLQRRVSPTADARAFGQLLRLIRLYRPDIIHTHLSKAGLLGRVAGRLASHAPRAHTFHGNVFDGYFGRKTSMAILGVERALGRWTDAIVALSDLQRRELLDLRIGSMRRIAVIPLGVDLERFARVDRSASRAELGIPEERLAVVAVGRMVPIKRLELLIGAFRQIPDRQRNAHLYLVGGGPERQALEAQVSSLGLEGNVTFVGWSTDIPHWYGAADVVALSSAREGTPLALIEAAAAGRPVVTTAVGGVPDVVEEDVTGRIVPDGDEAAFESALVELLSSPELRQRMGANAAQRSGRFGAERLVNDMDRLYRRLLEGRR